jgi:broad specificity phosphatase PhoE
MSRIVLLRHAQAEKNVADRHGGEGTRLTALGRAQCALLSEDLTAYFSETTAIFYLEKPQCDETAELLASKSHLSKIALTGFTPFHLGVLDGLSRAEAYQRFPDVAEAMDRWRRGMNEIHSLQIPGATNPSEFYQQGVRLLNHLTSNRDDCIVVGTRSVLVLLWNVLRGRRPEAGGGYFERPWSNLEWVEFIKPNCTEWREERTQRPPPELCR